MKRLTVVAMVLAAGLAAARCGRRRQRQQSNGAVDDRTRSCFRLN